MNLIQLADHLRNSEEYNKNITSWKEIPAKKAVYAEFPETINNKMIQILKNKGISKLYSHQAEAYSTARIGKNLIVVTPTASGKTLCFDAPRGKPTRIPYS